MKKKILLTLLLMFSLSFGFSQRSQEEQMGIQFFQSGEYEKAAAIFEKVYNASPNSYIYYYYYQTLLQLGNFKEAEKVVKKQQKNMPKVQRYKIDLGFVYESSGDSEKAEKVYTDAIKDLSAQESTVKELYNSFLVRKQFNYALAALQKGRKILNNSKLFAAEITNLYIQMNQTDKVVDEALALVADNSQGNVQAVEVILQNLLSNDEDQQKYLTVKTILQQRIQQQPDNICYELILQWIFLLHKDYPDALIMSKSIDRKLKEDGQRIYQLARESSANKDYATAIEALNYLISKGERGTYYSDAEFLLLDVKYEQLSATLPINLAQALVLEQEFYNTLTTYGFHEGTADWVRKYAHLLAFYVNKPDKAMDILNQAIAQTERDPAEQAAYKIDLADIELFMGDIWEATLHYSQVDKDFPNDLIGQTAKFKNAKLSFYIGEFAWAKSQLDVLRAATSKLIANDAMYFSLLISDNEDDEEEEGDSLFSDNAESNVALRYYAKADFLIFQNKEYEAITLLDSILLIDPFGKLADDVYFQKAKVLIKKGDFFGAEQLLKEIITKHSYDLLADDATFQLAELYDYSLQDAAQAMEYYQKVLKDYPDSLFTVAARKRFRELRGDYNQSIN